MPKAILALRSYPLAMLMAALLFLCTLILATSSTGIVGGGGGGDEGSGLGGTGKSGVPGDSGFGGTGGPSPFLGTVDSGDQNTDNAAHGGQDPDDWPAPWLPRETETAAIPEEIAPLIELQRNPLRDPTRNPPPLFPDNPDALRIIEQDSSSLPAHLRRQLDLANSGQTFAEQPPLEIQLQIPELTAPEASDPALLLQHTPDVQTASQDVTPEPDPQTPKSESDSLSGELESTSTSNDIRTVADHSDEEIPEIITESSQQTDPRNATERIQRPELPPFQRMRPAVDRASVLPSRPQPMRI